MPNITMTTTMSFDQAVQIFNNCLESRKMALKQELIHDPAEYKTWLEAEIARIGQAEIPSDSDITYVRRYMRHWQACDVLLKERARQEQSRKATMFELLKTFEDMKQGR